MSFICSISIVLENEKPSKTATEISQIEINTEIELKQLYSPIRKVA